MRLSSIMPLTQQHSSHERIVSRPQYREWNTAIAAFFFNETQQGRPVYLQCDTDVLRTIGQQLGIPADQSEQQFVAAVRSYVFPKNMNPPAYNVVLAARFLSQDPNAPTPHFIGFLAFCVLAASHMERDIDIGVSAANYYHRLNDLLGLARTGRPTWFADTLIAWKKLEEWLHTVQQGRYGFATAQPLNPAHPYVGYPQSQCLLRAADRQRLSIFFRWARFGPSDIPSRDLIATLFHDWATHPRTTLSPHIKRRIQLGGDGEREAIAAMVILELQSWDGHLGPHQTGTGRSIEVGLIHLMIRPVDRRVFWYHYNNEELQALDAPPALFTRTVSDADDAVVIFGDHPELSQWTQTTRTTIGEQHMLLVHSAYLDDLRTWLTRRAEPGWIVDTLVGIPANWCCVRGVTLREADSHAPWAALRMHDLLTVRLQGGLLLDRDVYLCGFEPTLFIEGPGAISNIRLDQHDLPMHPGDRSLIRLDQYHLQPGYHILTIGSRTRTFLTRLPYRADQSRILPSIGYVLHHSDEGYLPQTYGAIPLERTPPLAGTVSICGAIVLGAAADMPAALPHTLILQDGFRGYIVLGRRCGEIIEHRTIFTREQGMQTAREQWFRVEVPFEPQWLIKIGRKKHYLSAVLPVVQLPLEKSNASPDKCARWRQMVKRKSYIWRGDNSQQAVWDLYTLLQHT